MTRMLVVEDSRTQAEELAFLLESQGFTVEIARDGREGLQRAVAERYDLVLSDVVMPELDGYELCRALKAEARTADTPVILLTTLSEPMDVIRGLECGADNFLTKPYEPDYLLERIRRILAHKALRAGRKMTMGVELLLLGKRFVINSEKEQMLDLLISTFEEAVRARQKEYETRLSEVAARESQRFLQSTLDALSAQIAILDEVGAIVAVNAAWRRFSEANDLTLPEAGVGKRYLHVCETVLRVDATSLQRIDAGVRQLVAGRTDALYLECRERIGGADRWFAVSATRCEGQGPARVVMAHEDITPRKESERRAAVQHAVTAILAGADALAESCPKILGTVCEGLGWDVGEVWLADAGDAGDSGETLRCAAWWHRPGLRLDEFERVTRATALARGQGLVGRAWATGQVAWVADVAADPTFARPAAAHVGLHGAFALPLTVGREVVGVVAFLHQKVQPPDDELVRMLVAVAGQMGQFVERARAQEAVRESEERVRLLLESTAEAIVALDLEGRCTWCNPAAVRLLGHAEPAALIGRPVHELIHPRRADGTTCRGGALCALARLGGTTPTHADDEVFCRADGGSFPAEFWSHPVRKDGGVVGTVLTFLDITERRRAEVALRKSEEQLQQAQKMEAIGRLAGGVAHDFNNLLAVIASYSELLLGEVPEGDSKREDIAEIKRAAERAAALTHQLLAFSRSQVLQATPLNLNAVVTGLEKMLRRILGEDVALACDLDSALGQITADAGRIEQVVMNLVVNARDAMPRGGRLTVRTRNVDVAAGATDHPPTVAPGRYVTLAVTDTGVGMDAETQARIFEPFFTTKELGKGTGLGLATVHGIVQQSGGQIAVESEVGRGTTFVLYFPRIDAAPVAVAPPPVAVGRDGGATILLVEDEEAVRVVAARILRQHRYDVIAAASGEEAARICEERSDPVDLILTDVVMPGMSGPELVARVARSRPGVRVLYMSGYTGHTIVHHGVLDQGAPFLEKPFTPETLARKVREALGDGRG